jgi:hypothetical protein
MHVSPCRQLQEACRPYPRDLTRSAPLSVEFGAAFQAAGGCRLIRTTNGGSGVRRSAYDRWPPRPAVLRRSQGDSGKYFPPLAADDPLATLQAASTAVSGDCDVL